VSLGGSGLYKIGVHEAEITVLMYPDQETGSYQRVNDLRAAAMGSGTDRPWLHPFGPGFTRFENATGVVADLERRSPPARQTEPGRIGGGVDIKTGEPR
jgi:hypothetical protein